MADDAPPVVPRRRRIVTDAYCRRCGYNVRGVEVDAADTCVCPECAERSTAYYLLDRLRAARGLMIATDPKMPGGRTTLFLIHAMVVTGGVAALSWEVVWQLQTALAFGVSATGTALTLAATMGGMAIGSVAAGRWLEKRSIARPLRLYGALELAIGLAGLLMLPGYRGLEGLDARVYAQIPSLAPLLHAAGVALLLGPATLAMGATVPVFQLVARRHGTSVSVLYGANTAGAAAGVLLLSFGLLPAFGVTVTCAIVASLNGAVFLASPALRPGAAPDETPTAPRRAARAASGVAARAVPLLPQLMVLCTGFVTFGLEVAWFRALRSAFWSTSSTFAIMLAAVLIPLAVGARIVPWLRRRGVSPGPMLAAAGVAVILATPLVERMDLIARIRGEYHAVLALWLLLSLVLMGPAVLCLATVLPWCLEEHRAPGVTGRLYGLNTLGSVGGALSAAWVILPNLGFARTAWVLGLLPVAVALAATRRRWIPVVAGAAAMLVAVAFASSPGRDRLMGQRDFGGGRILAHVEGPDFTTSVIEQAPGVRVLMIDGFAATSENPLALHYMQWMGTLPALLHPDPARGLVICFGTGQTANALRREGPAELDLVDISRSVFELAPLFSTNERVLEDARARAFIMDGRAWLRRRDRQYDVVTLEPMPPNFAGMNSLYSSEFYEMMSRRLAPDGVVAQWLPIHLVTPAHAASIAATFLAVFPDSILWIDPVGGTGILLGRRAGAAEPLGASWPGLARSALERGLSEEEVRAAVLLEKEGLARYARGAEIVTDDNQLLQFSAQRAGHSGDRALRLLNENLLILSAVAGREPLVRGLRR